ncbi:MAG: hypothetical protein RSD22_09530 [Romboutsia sp.]
MAIVHDIIKSHGADINAMNKSKEGFRVDIIFKDRMLHEKH